MIRVVGLAVVAALAATSFAYADDDDLSAADAKGVNATLSMLGCDGYEEIEKEDVGVFEIEDAKCKMGVVDIKLDKDYSVILISRF